MKRLDVVSRDWVRPYDHALREYREPITIRVIGKVPPSLCGKYIRNGPGLLNLAGDEVAHPFDGDGAVCSIEFDGTQSIKFQSRFIETDEYAPVHPWSIGARLPAGYHLCEADTVCTARVLSSCLRSRYLAEQKQQKRMARGSFGTNIPGGTLANLLDVYPKNAANIGVMSAGGRLFALFEGGQPHELDPQTLETLEICTLNGILSRGAPFNVDWLGLSGLAGNMLSGLRWMRGLEPSKVHVGGDAFASHYQRDWQRKRTVCMSFQVAVRATTKLLLLCSYLLPHPIVGIARVGVKCGSAHIA
jgi:hypothetical protein